MPDSSIKETGMLFNEDMVLAILDGRKTQTRRLDNLKEINENPNDWKFDRFVLLGKNLELHAYFVNSQGETRTIKSKYGKKGDLIWGRETIGAESYASRSWNEIWYIADNSFEDVEIPSDWSPPINSVRTHTERGDNIPGGSFNYYTAKVPSIFMPRWASRIQLKITDVRVERLQNISVEDSLAEGINHQTMNCPKHEYFQLWNRIYGDLSHEKNPWVWVYEFNRENTKHA